MKESEYFGFQLWEDGDTDWEHRTDFEIADEEALRYGPLEARPPATETLDGRKWLDEHGVVSQVDGGEWILESVGSEERPVPRGHFESTETGEARIADLETDDRTSDPGANRKLQAHNEGQIVGEQFRSWPMRRPTLTATLPTGRSKARIAFNFDGSNVEEYEQVFPELRDRGFPWTNNLTRRRFGGSGNLTLEQVREMNAYGMEVGAYVHDESWNNLHEVDEPQRQVETLLYNRRDLEDAGFPVSFLKGRNDALVHQGMVDDPLSYAIRSTYLCSTGNAISPSARNTVLAPMAGHHAGQNHQMQGKSGEDLVGYLDRLVEVGGQAPFFAHANHDGFDIGAFRTLLDAAERYRDAGKLEVSTVSGLYLLSDDLDAYNAVSDPTAEGSAAFSVHDYWSHTRGSPATESDGGKAGDSYYVLEKGDRIGLLRSGIEPRWPVAVAEFYARAPEGQTATIQFAANSQNDWSVPARRFFEVGDSWERCFATCGFHREEDRMLFYWEADGGTAHLDDIRLYPA